MLGKKLLERIKSLEENELVRLKDFVISPYFNKHEGCRDLLRYLIDWISNSAESPCFMDYAEQLFDGDEVEAKKKLGPYMTYTLQLVDQFIVQEAFQKQGFLMQQLGLEAFRKRRMYKTYEKKVARLSADVEREGYQDLDYYRIQFKLAEEANTYYDLKASRAKDTNLEKKQYYLDRFYLLSKLQDACEMIMRKRILNLDYEDPIFESLLSFIKANQNLFQTDPAIRIYYSLYNLLAENDPSLYQRTYMICQEGHEIFALAERKSIYNYLQNFCIAAINAGNPDFLKSIFELYQLQLDQELLIEDEYLSEWHYKNIVTTGLRLGETDWVLKFIENYKARLAPDSRQNAYTFNLASYYYATKQYDQVLELLTEVSYKDLRYTLGAKALMLRTYYDLESFESLFHLVDSFRMYLLRNRLMAKTRRDGYYNLFRLTKKAAQLRLNLEWYSREKAQQSFQKLEEHVQKTPYIFNKSWLLEKVTELSEMVGGQ